MNIDATFFVIGSGIMVIIFIGFLLWAIKTGQFKDAERLRTKPLEDENE